VPGLDRHPLKKLGADEDALLRLLQRWPDVRFACTGDHPAPVAALGAAVAAIGKGCPLHLLKRRMAASWSIWNSSVTLATGIGNTFRETSVTRPSVPREPANSLETS